MPGSGPAPPPREVRRLLAPLLADPPRTAIVSDFDGTLSPIVDHPADARPLPGSGALLRQLAHRFGLVAVVSGRPVSFLIEHLATAGPGDGASGGAGPKFIGLYGMEQSSADGTTVPHPDAVAWRPVLDAATDRYNELVERGESALQRLRSQRPFEETTARAEGYVDQAVELTQEALGTVASQTRAVGERAAKLVGIELPKKTDAAAKKAQKTLAKKAPAKKAVTKKAPAKKVTQK